MKQCLKTLLTATLLLLYFLIHAQDPFSTHFYGNEAQFNPALVGYKGALSIGVKAKHQWQSRDLEGYRTYQLTYEESMPCSFFDYGLSLLHDTEGEGLLNTLKLGGMIAAPLRLPDSRNGDIFQIRLGMGLHWGQQYIDYSRLLFIDQLDPKYGLVNANGQSISSSFAAPNDGYSNWYFQPSGGIVFQYILNATKKKAIDLMAGFAVHNLVPLIGATERGHSWSLLGIGTPTAPRYTLFARGEIVTGYYGNNFFAVRPQFFAQRQRGITYWELGSHLSFSKQFSIGGYLHASRPNEGLASSNWGSAQFEVGFFPSELSRVDLGFGYAFNFSGLRNHIGNIFELTLRFSFASSPMCTLAGNPAPYDPKRTIPCPTVRRSGRNKIYENIWYRNNQ